MTRSRTGSRAFATLRVAGDELDPDDITRLLGVQPSEAHRKGETFATGRARNLSARTGIWQFDTSRVPNNGDLDDHVLLILHLLGVREGLSRLDLGRLVGLGEFLRERRLQAVLTLFWHGSARASRPQTHDWLGKLLSPFGISVEPDFDKDEDAPQRRRVA